MDILDTWTSWTLGNPGHLEIQNLEIQNLEIQDIWKFWTLGNSGHLQVVPGIAAWPAGPDAGHGAAHRGRGTATTAEGGSAR
ncbi:MAG: hypothetical protein FWD12_13590, partial [Alphaproteobacteria bacterium]|nr:hypothetical protein [Alphaproteobacteria bacterium]